MELRSSARWSWVIGRVIFPFVLGGAIAFVLNVPMHFIEEKFFGSKKMKKNKWANKFARPVSFLVTILFGRHFCGYACAFGSLGDAMYELTVFYQTESIS